MSGFSFFIILVVLIVTVGKIVRQGMDLERRKVELRSGGGGDVAGLERENAMLRSKLERLEDRTAVLERIATDAPARLTAEIEKLRD
jgi:hypothetical protein